MESSVVWMWRNIPHDMGAAHWHVSACCIRGFDFILHIFCMYISYYINYDSKLKTGV